MYPTFGRWRCRSSVRTAGRRSANPPSRERTLMSKHRPESGISRRAMLGTMGKAAAGFGLAPASASGRNPSGPSRRHGGAGQRRCGSRPRRRACRERRTCAHGQVMANRRGRRRAAAPRPTPRRPRRVGPPPTVRWSKKSGPGRVTFADPAALITTATLERAGRLRPRVDGADSGGATASSTLTVKVETPPPAKQLDVVHMRKWSIDSTLWNHRMKALTVSWIPHCIEHARANRHRARAGIDNFIEAGKKLRGEPHGQHKGYVFANAYVHNAVEAMSIALMLDAEGRPGHRARADRHARDARQVDSDHPRRAGTRRLHADGVHAAARQQRRRQPERPGRSTTGSVAPTTRDTPPATSSRRRSLTT